MVEAPLLDMCSAGHLETVLSLSSHPLTRGEFSRLLILCLDLAIFVLPLLTGWVGHPLIHVILHVTLANCPSINCPSIVKVSMGH